jgi:hypothetical protein
MSPGRPPKVGGAAGATDVLRLKMWLCAGAMRKPVSVTHWWPRLASKCGSVPALATGIIATKRAELTLFFVRDAHG